MDGNTAFVIIIGIVFISIMGMAVASYNSDSRVITPVIETCMNECQNAYVDGWGSRIEPEKLHECMLRCIDLEQCEGDKDE